MIPDKVKVNVTGSVLLADGPLGKERVVLNPGAKVEVKDGKVLVTRPGDTTADRCVQGTVRSLVANAVHGVSKGYSCDLEINGVGYRAEVKGPMLSLTLGFSHPVEYTIPAGIKIMVEKQTKLTISGSNKYMVGQVSAHIRGFKPPEPYKGKGIKYGDERIIRKVGKAAGAGAGGAAAGGK
jgi:large subunit ribosomal protein L6